MVSSVLLININRGGSGFLRHVRPRLDDFVRDEMAYLADHTLGRNCTPNGDRYFDYIAGTARRLRSACFRCSCPQHESPPGIAGLDRIDPCVLQTAERMFFVRRS